MTKPDKIDLILQLILDICVLGIIKTISFDLGKNFGVAFDTLFLAPLNDFYQVWSHGGHTFKKKRMLSRHFPRPAETDPYMKLNHFEKYKYKLSYHDGNK